MKETTHPHVTCDVDKCNYSIELGHGIELNGPSCFGSHFQAHLP